ncbi:uncharacterized protein LOC141666310 [Apium graveolens]|uniref:uncharacterized protein LOC141666310 n=1 Tax=Apium graveolens TaxID=4045 RepID=UPI003D7B3196
MDKRPVSVDAAIFEDRNEAGFGMVARDSDGQLLEAKVLTQAEALAPVLTEAIAVKEALSWIDQKRWLPVILESDCLVVVQAIRSAAPMRSRFGEVISKCRNLVRRLNNIQLLFVKRSANMVAHQLARESYRYPGRIFDRWSILIYIQTCIEKDLLS